MGNSNALVIIDKFDYKTNTKRILSDSTKFEKLKIDEIKSLGFLIDSEEKLQDIIKSLYQKQCLTKKEWEYFTAVLSCI